MNYFRVTAIDVITEGLNKIWLISHSPLLSEQRTNSILTSRPWGHAVLRGWLRHYATRFQLPMRWIFQFTSSFQPWDLIEMSSRNLREVKGGRRLRLQIHCHLWADCIEPRRPTTLWVSMACYRDSFTFYFNALFEIQFLSCISGFTGQTIVYVCVRRAESVYTSM
jgi:hypothetical protein